MKISAKVDMSKLEERMRRAVHRTLSTIDDVLYINALAIQGDVRKSLHQVTSRHKKYTVTKSGKVHYSSLPGTPPNSSSGKLASGIIVDRGRGSVTIRSTVVYAAIHEFGGKTGRAEIPARPYLWPAVQRNRTKLKAMLKRRIKRDLQ